MAKTSEHHKPESVIRELRGFETQRARLLNSQQSSTRVLARGVAAVVTAAALEVIDAKTELDVKSAITSITAVGGLAVTGFSALWKVADRRSARALNENVQAGQATLAKLMKDNVV